MRSTARRIAADRDRTPTSADVTEDEREADVAQLAERVLGKDEVTSSILVIGSNLRSRPGEQRATVGKPDRRLSAEARRREGGRVRQRRGRRRHGQRKIRPQQTARERRHHRAHRPRQDHPDRGAHQGVRRQGLGEVHLVRRSRQGVRVAGPPRRFEGHDHRDEPRRVLDREAALRARRLPGPRRLHQEHDHRRRADGRRHPRGQRRRRPDAADARARAARPAGQRAVSGRRAQQGRRDRRPRAARPGRARSARAAHVLRLPRQRHPGGPPVGAQGAAGRCRGRRRRRRS